MADITTLQLRLTEAENAAHALATGERVVEVTRDGRTMKFQTGDAGRLNTYITDLRSQIADATIATEGARPRRRFIPVAFG